MKRPPAIKLSASPGLDLISLRSAAQLYSCSTSAMCHRVKRHAPDLPRYRFEGEVYFRRADLAELYTIPAGYITTAEVARRLSRVRGQAMSGQKAHGWARWNGLRPRHHTSSQQALWPEDSVNEQLSTRGAYVRPPLGPLHRMLPEPPPGWLSLSATSKKTGIPLQRLQNAAGVLSIVAVRVRGKLYVDPDDASARLSWRLWRCARRYWSAQKCRAHRVMDATALPHYLHPGLRWVYAPELLHYR